MPVTDHIKPEILKNDALATEHLLSGTELNKLQIEIGFLGQFWGSPNSIPNNIAGLAILIALLTGCGMTFYSLSKPIAEVGISIKDIWAVILPIVTLFAGYLFGDKAGRNSKANS